MVLLLTQKLGFSVFSKTVFIKLFMVPSFKNTALIFLEILFIQHLTIFSCKQYDVIDESVVFLSLTWHKSVIKKQHFYQLCHLLTTITPFLNTIWRHHWSNLHNRKTLISLKRKKIFQKEKRHSSVFWKAFQISRYFFSLHMHFNLLAKLSRRNSDSLQ